MAGFNYKNCKLFLGRDKEPPSQRTKASVNNGQ